MKYVMTDEDEEWVREGQRLYHAVLTAEQSSSDELLKAKEAFTKLFWADSKPETLRQAEADIDSVEGSIIVFQSGEVWMTEEVPF